MSLRRGSRIDQKVMGPRCPEESRGSKSMSTLMRMAVTAMMLSEEPSQFTMPDGESEGHLQDAEGKDSAQCQFLPRIELQTPQCRQGKQDDYDILNRVNESNSQPRLRQRDTVPSGMLGGIPDIGHGEAAEEDFEKGGDTVEDGKDHDCVCGDSKPFHGEDGRVEMEDGQLDQGIGESPLRFEAE